MKKLWVPVIFILVMSLILGACTSQTPATTSAPPASSADKTLTIGNINSLTGMFSDFEKFDPQGAQLAADLINNRGGITINGQKYLIDLYVLDGKSTPDGFAAAATAMIYDKNIKFLCGTGVAPLAQAVDTVTEQAGALFSARYQSGVPNEMGPKFPLKFVGGSCYLSAMKSNLVYLKQIHPEIKTIAFSATDDGALQTIAPLLQNIASGLGLTLKGDIIGVSPDLVDLTPIAQKILSRDADATMIGNMTLTQIGSIIRGVRGIGYTKPIFASTWANMGELLRITGEDAMNGMFTCGFPPDPSILNLPQNAQDLIKLGLAKYGTFNSTHLQGANGLYSLVMAIQAAQSLDPKVVAAKWETLTSIDTPLGSGTMGGLKTYGVNHNVYTITPIRAYTNGTIHVVAWIPIDQAIMP